MIDILQHLVESFTDWIGVKTGSLFVLIMGIIGGVIGHFIAKKKEAIAQNRPALEKLWNSLKKNELKEQIGDFANKETIYENIIVKRDEGNILRSLVDGKPLSCPEISSFSCEVKTLIQSLSFIDLPKLVKEGIRTIDNSLDTFRISHNEFNKCWPGNTYIRKQHESKFLDDLNEIGQKASLLKTQKVELQCRIEDELKRKWWLPW